MQTTQAKLQQAISAVIKKASKDAAYRERAIKEPIAVLNEAGGLDLPLNTPIRFADKVEETLVPLPAFGSDPDEITDEEMLGSVSGGVTVTVLFFTAGIVATIYISVKDCASNG